MFGRLLWKLLRGNRGRLTVALVAVISGAAVISALLNLEFDVERKLTQEFRLLGANIVISPGNPAQANDAPSNSPATSASPALMSEAAVLPQVDRMRTSDVVASAPYVYIVARARYSHCGCRDVARRGAQARANLEARRRGDRIAR
jgi:hypothetical protein